MPIKITEDELFRDFFNSFIAKDNFSKTLLPMTFFCDISCHIFPFYKNVALLMVLRSTLENLASFKLQEKKGVHVKKEGFCLTEMKAVEACASFCQQDYAV